MIEEAKGDEMGGVDRAESLNNILRPAQDAALLRVRNARSLLRPNPQCEMCADTIVLAVACQ
jgi:hypothetical protein